MWVEVCDKCKGYLKVIVSFTPAPADRLPIEDLTTLHLDWTISLRHMAINGLLAMAFATRDKATVVLWAVFWATFFNHLLAVVVGNHIVHQRGCFLCRPHGT